MVNKTRPQTELTSPESLRALEALQDAGFGNMLGVSTAWAEAFSDLSAELVGFVADRIKEDVKTQHQILHCKDVAELQHIQAQFIQTAIEQYQAETGKLMEMSANAFSDYLEVSKKS